MAMTHSITILSLTICGFTWGACGISNTHEEIDLIISGKAEQQPIKHVLVDFSQEMQTIPDGWEIKEWAGRTPEPELISDEGTQALRLISEQNSYALNRDLDIDPTTMPYLSWDWKVTALPIKGDFRYSQSDDQAAQLIFAFSDTNVLSYVWDSNPENLGKIGDVPFGYWTKKALGINEAKVIVVAAGDINLATWITEQRNLVEDYETAFEQALPEGVVLKKMLIQINSQHTKSSAESYWGSVVLSDAPLANTPVDYSDVDYSDRDKVVGAPALH